MKKSKQEKGKVALYLLTKSLRKQSTDSLIMIIDISNRIIEERPNLCKK